MQAGICVLIRYFLYSLFLLPLTHFALWALDILFFDRDPVWVR